MSKKSEKQPWNPFPLATLNVRGLSPCAKAVLIVLGARSNYKGQTCVGHRRLCGDLERSRDFVTKGLLELYDKKIVAHADRNRSKGQAEWRTISQSILKNRTEESILSTDDQSCLAGSINPEQQDCISPDHQCKTLQIRTTPNLTDENNLTDQNLKPVSQSVSQLTTRSASPHSSDVPPSAGKTDQFGSVAEPKATAEPSWLEEQSAELSEEILESDLYTLFGLPYFSSDAVPYIQRIAWQVRIAGKSIAWLKDLISFALAHKFWSKRLHAAERGWSQLANFLESGELPAQFNAHLAAIHKGVELEERSAYLTEFTIPTIPVAAKPREVTQTRELWEQTQAAYQESLVPDHELDEA